MRDFQKFLLLLIIQSFSLPILAATNWSLCSVPAITRQQPVDYNLFETEIEADRLLSENGKYTQFFGNVEFQRSGQRIMADELKLFREPQRVTANGNLSYADSLLSINAATIEMDNSQHSGLFTQAEFQLYENHLRGKAERIVQFDADHSELFDVSYTTCDPDSNAWSLSAGKLELDQQTGQGTAHNAVFRIAALPVFYFPWLMFPIDDRRMSGLLAPTLAHTQSSGTQLALPVYWNQAENYDMTITPVWYSERGLQLNTENRYLFNQHQGMLTLSALDDDKYNADRWFRRWQHEVSSDHGIHTSILEQRVSDRDYLEDFDNLENISHSDFLKSAVSVSSQLSAWSTQLLFEKYQTVNPDKPISSRPYKRLPRLTLNRANRPLFESLMLDWNNEWVKFDREDSITGNRLHISPELSYLQEGDYYYIKPSLQLDHTQYRLDNNLNDINSIERSIPLLSLDSGLFFERLTTDSGKWMQTLEPRAYFLYVPEENQSDIPDFDTSLSSENYASLFKNNRFSGADRIGDSQQITLALSSRLLAFADGRELLSASLGQAFYARDRVVSLDGSIDDRDKSSLMTLIKFKPQPEWDIQLSSAYDQQEKESKQTDISLRRQLNRQLLNLEYHFVKDQLEQSTLSFVYPHSDKWTSFFKRQYSIRQDKPVQNLLGLAYESCCWGLNILYEESSDSYFNETDRAVYFQLTFKGLSKAGKDIDSILEDGILGYQPNF